MPNYGFTLFSELSPPDAQVDQAIAAEEAGFDFIGISDHFHPWLSRHTDSGFAWSVLGAIAARTARAELITLVTCPFVRYHPAIIAQSAATVQLLSDGRFTDGARSGRRRLRPGQLRPGRAGPHRRVPPLVRRRGPPRAALTDRGLTRRRG
nr:LLM class flavin-dependent oxidoreductase [Nitriliruptor alkaliphilus]